MIRRVISLTVAALALVAATTATPPAPAHAATSYADCYTGWVQVKAYSGIPVYNYYTSSKELRGYLKRNTVIACAGPVDVGSRYNGCGATSVNAWLYVSGESTEGKTVSGWTYATCLVDYFGFRE